MKITSHVPPPLIWHISQIIFNVFSLVVSDCVLNQSCGHWLPFDALNAIIIMSLKLKEKYEISSNLQDLIDDEYLVTHELSLFTSNIKREACGILDGFFSFFKKYEGNKTHNMSLVLDPRFKSLRLVSSLIWLRASYFHYGRT
jgi:hypothetical protein